MLCYMYHIVGNVRGRKLSRISLLCAYQRKFSPRLIEGSVDRLQVHVGTSEEFTKVFSAKYDLSTNS